MVSQIMASFFSKALKVLIKCSISIRIFFQKNLQALSIQYGCKYTYMKCPWQIYIFQQ